jgi:lycopene beta-cyclase
MASTLRCDVAIVGAGLAGGLVALALAQRHPDLDVRLIDGAECIGGNHRWSYFATDVAPADHWIVAPLVGHSWPAHRVAFADHERRIEASYHSIDSLRLDAVVRAALPERALLLGRRVLAVSPITVVLADGDRVEAGGVIDARGAGELSNLDLGWQKFVGRELALAAPHDLDAPIIMDATVDQRDGYRFVYSLPLAPDRMFVEDTYYTDGPALDQPRIAGLIDAYAAGRGWQVARVERQEAGVLPVAMGGDIDAYWRAGGAGVAKAGMRAGLFHPMTGYSLPDAVRTAAMLAGGSRFDAATLHEATYALARRTWQERGFYRLLARLLFRAAAPAERHRVFERFYRLDQRLIERFYAGNSIMTDRLRILSGKPPVPLGAALAAIRERRR